MAATGYVSVTGDTRKVSKAGDTMTGELGLPDASPDTPLTAAPRAYVDAVFEAALADAVEKYVALIGDQVIAGEKTFADRIPVAPGFDPAFDNQLTRKAYVDAKVAQAGGGASIASLDGRIDAQIVVPPPVAGWAIVATSGGVEIGTSIPAAVGDRLWFSPSFLRTYGIVLDLGIKAAVGGVSRYVSSGAATPETDGYAPLYPQSAFAGVVGLRQFVVQAGEVDGAGNAKIVLAYRGNSADGTTQKVYFGGGPGYSGAIFVANVGP